MEPLKDYKVKAEAAATNLPAKEAYALRSIVKAIEERAIEGYKRFEVMNPSITASLAKMAQVCLLPVIASCSPDCCNDPAVWPLSFAPSHRTS